jgi:hypothetical protein
MDLTKAHSDDRVEYHLYRHSPDTSTPELLKWKAEVENWVEPFICNYIWQVEPFSLRPGKVSGDLLHLHGHSLFGDNIDDEWFIVWLLKRYSLLNPGVFISVQDNDGEFLLIEVAPALPRWVRPDVVENRIWLHGGELHIIPQPQDPAELLLIPEDLQVGEVPALLLSPEIESRAAPEVQQLLEQRLAGYPQKAADSVHWARCLLPLEVAQLLHQLPATVAPAVRAFYYRDFDDGKIALALKRFLPQGEPRLVFTRVKFSRCLFAQLNQQKFVPPRQYPAPPPLSSPDYKAYILGCKLLCGFEIFYQHQAAESLSSSGNTNFINFLANLKKLGYFAGELQDSPSYKERLRLAKTFFESEGGVAEAATLLDSAIRSCPTTEFSCSEADSDEQWMVIDPAELDELLLGRSGQPEQLLQNVSSFVGANSGYEGIDNDEPLALDPEKLVRLTRAFFGEAELASSDDEDGLYEDLADNSDGDSLLRTAMAAMDAELEVEGDRALDVDATVVSNLLQSFVSQYGASGPLSNLLGEFLHKE